MSANICVRKYFRRHVFSNLRTRLLLLILFILLPALALSIYTASEQDSVASAAAQQEALRLAQLAAANQSQFVEGAEQLLIALARIPAVYEGQPEMCSEIFSTLREEYHNYTNIFMVDAEGDAICSGIPMQTPINVSGRGWFEKALDDRSFSVSEYDVGAQTGRPVITFSYPIFNEDGSIQYLVGTSLDLERVSGLITRVQLPPDTTLAAIDRQGVILYRFPDSEAWIGRSVAAPELVEQIVAQGTGAVEATGSDDVRRLYGFSPLDAASTQPSTYVIIGISSENAFPQGARLLAQNLIGLGVVGLLTLVAAWVGTERILMRHISALVRTALRLADGDLTARVDTAEIKSTNELGQLAFAFNDMAEALQANRDELEARVKARTSELAELYGEVSQQRNLAEALRDVATTLSSTLELNEVLDRLLENVGRVVPHDTANIMFLDEGVARVARCRGYDELGLKAITEAQFPIATTPTLRQMLTTGKPVLIADMLTLKDSADHTDSTWLRSYLGVPVCVGETIIGFLNLHSAKPDFFVSEHSDRLQAFAAQAAIAIENARLYEQAADLAVLQERQRLAHDLHDAVSQILFSSSLIAQSLPRLWKAKPEKVDTSLEQIYRLNRGAHAELRTLLLELNEEKLGEAKLDELLLQLADGTTGRYNINVKLQIEGKPDTVLSQKEKIAFYRIAQEALNNVAKHAKAKNVDLRLSFAPERVALHVHDDGRGFDANKPASMSMGLGIMQERAASIGAVFTVQSQMGVGTDVDVVWEQEIS